jgi:hypothetical protein
MTKGTKREASEPRHSQNWVLARRGSFRIYDEKIVCGDWIIPFKDIKKLTIYKTKQLFMNVTVLHFATENGNYQFGFNPWAHPEKHLMNLKPEEEVVKLKFSLFSVILRIIIFVGLLVYFITRFNS